MLLCCTRYYKIHQRERQSPRPLRGALLHELATLYMYAIFRCSGHAVDRRNRGKVPQIRQQDADLPCQDAKRERIRVQLHTPQRKKLLGGLRWLACEVALVRSPGSGNGRRTARTSWPAWIFNLLITPFCQSQKPFCIGAPKFANLRTTNHRRRRTSDRTMIPRARAPRAKAQCLESESVPPAG